MALDVVTSKIHLKVKGHNNLGKLIVISINLRGARLIHDAILKNPSAIFVASEKKRKKTLETIVMTINLNVREDKTLQDDEFGSLSGVNSQILRTVPNENFEVR